MESRFSVVFFSVLGLTLLCGAAAAVLAFHNAGGSYVDRLFDMFALGVGAIMALLTSSLKR